MRTDRMLCNLITLIDCRAIRHPLVDDNSHRGVKGDGRKVPQRQRRRIVRRLLETVLWDSGVRRIHIRREGKYLRLEWLTGHRQWIMVELCLQKLSQDLFGLMKSSWAAFFAIPFSKRSALRDQVVRFIISRAVFHFTFNSSFLWIARSDGGGCESCKMFKKETTMISLKSQRVCWL